MKKHTGKNNRRNRKHQSLSKRQSKQKSGNSRQALFEALENRQMLSASVLDSGTLFGGHTQTMWQVASKSNAGLQSSGTPTVRDLKVTHQDRQVTITARNQPGVSYLVQVQGNATAPLVFVSNGALPLTFTPPIDDRVFGVIVTPIANGATGKAVSRVMDVGRVANPNETPAPYTPTVQNLKVTQDERQVTVTAGDHAGVN
jgi:hypothetical protein